MIFSPGTFGCLHLSQIVAESSSPVTGRWSSVCMYEDRVDIEQ